MGQVQKSLNHLSEAVDFHMQAKEAYLAISDGWGLALSLYNLGVLSLLQGLLNWIRIRIGTSI